MPVLMYRLFGGEVSHNAVVAWCDEDILYTLKYWCQYVISIFFILVFLENIWVIFRGQLNAAIYLVLEIRVAELVTKCIEMSEAVHIPDKSDPVILKIQPWKWVSSRLLNHSVICQLNRQSLSSALFWESTLISMDSTIQPVHHFVVHLNVRLSLGTEAESAG